MDEIFETTATQPHIGTTAPNPTAKPTKARPYTLTILFGIVPSSQGTKRSLPLQSKALGGFQSVRAGRSLILLFDITIFGFSYDTLYVGTAGVLALDVNSGTFNTGIPGASLANQAICPYWDDFQVTGDAKTIGWKMRLGV
ncbi:hypothetical protein ACHAP5_005527 [Fusarium lateritium]